MASANSELTAGLANPIENTVQSACSAAQKEFIGGTFPFGLRNQTWHPGIHLSTIKKIVAVADGEVVAYRFCEEDFSEETGGNTFSSSFVLLKHRYESALGNSLDYFSLYMHLESKPSGDFLPAFLYDTKDKATGSDRPVAGSMIFDSNKRSSSKHLIPLNAIVSVIEEKKYKKGDRFKYTEISYTDIDGTVHEGVIRYSKTSTTQLKQNENKQYYIGRITETLTYGTEKKEWNGNKNKKGITLWKETNESGDKQWLIPNGTIVEYESVPNFPGWGKLLSPLPNSVTEGPFYIKIQGNLTATPVASADESKLGSLQIPEPDKRPRILANDVLGKAAPHCFVQDTVMVHHEIFTPEPLLAENSFLNDPSGERFFAEKTCYTVPVGQEISPLPVQGIELKAEDYVTVLSTPEEGEYVQVQVTALVRIGSRNDLDYDTRVLCSLMGETAVRYTIVNLDTLNESFNGWLGEASALFLKKQLSDPARKLFFYCGNRTDTTFWIPKEALNEINSDNSSTLKQDVEFFYTVNPMDATKESSEELFLDNPEIITKDNKRYAPFEESSLIDITGIEPASVFTWPGFELLYEEPENHSAFVDTVAVKSVIRTGVFDLEETATVSELSDKTQTETSLFDLTTLTDPEWKERLRKMILRAPCEWQFSEEKYEKLEEILKIDPANPKPTDPDPALIKKLLSRTAFWDKLKDAGVFDGYSDLAKAGKELFYFHPLKFISYIDRLEKSGLTQSEKTELFTLINLVAFEADRAGTTITDEETCKALASCFYNRLGKYEWHQCRNFEKLRMRMDTSLAPVDSDTLAQILPWIAEVVLHKGHSSLPVGYVHFHGDSQTIEDQPWDSSMLDTESVVASGGLSFYRYKEVYSHFATTLTAKEVKLVRGGDCGESLPAFSGNSLLKSTNEGDRPYRYDMKEPPTWHFSFTFSIAKGTTEQETQKKNFFWQLLYYEKSDKTTVEKRDVIPVSGTTFTLTIPKTAVGYQVELIPCTGSAKEPIPLDDPIVIALKKRERLLFNGSTLKWLTETGEELPFYESDALTVTELTAFSGSGTDEDREKDTESVPAGLWWVKRESVEFWQTLNWVEKWLNWGWSGGVETWGKQRIWLEKHAENNRPEDEEKRALRGSCNINTEGHIHVYDKEAFLDQMDILVAAVIQRVISGGRLLLAVDYSELALFTIEILKEVTGANNTNSEKYFSFLKTYMQKGEINSPLRIVHFLSQLAHESGRLRYSEELASGSAYEGRKNLGNVQTGDGVRFKGRGLIQLTGRANYAEFEKITGETITTDDTVNKVALPKLASHSACWYWESRKLNELADKDEFIDITRKINGGLIGFSHRITCLKKGYVALNIRGWQSQMKKKLSIVSPNISKVTLALSPINVIDNKEEKHIVSNNLNRAELNIFKNAVRKLKKDKIITTAEMTLFLDIRTVTELDELHKKIGL